MAISNNSCYICKKRVLSHAYNLCCSNCKNTAHLNCLPNVSRNDSIYINRNDDDWYCINCVQIIFPFNHIEEDSTFLEVLSESWSAYSIPLNITNNKHKLFSPFEFNKSDSLPMHDVDPDVNFYQSVCNNPLNSCDYYFEKTFNQSIQN